MSVVLVVVVGGRHLLHRLKYKKELIGSPKHPRGRRDI